MMQYSMRAPLLGLILCALSGCGGGGGAASGGSTSASGSAVTIPTPTPGPAPEAPVLPVVTPTPAPAPLPTEERLILGANIIYAPGDYFAYAAPWCALNDKSIVVGRDIVDQISLLRSTFPNDVVITSQAPDVVTTKCGVYGFNYINYGHYLTNNVASKVKPKQVKDIQALTVSFDMTIGGNGDYNILTESFLSGAPKLWTEKIEVGFFTHSASITRPFAKTGTPIGTFVDPSGRSWSVSRVKDFVMFIVDGNDILSGTLDVKGAYDFLIARSVLTGNEWFNGIATGLEPVRGSGTTTIRAFSVDFR